MINQDYYKPLTFSVCDLIKEKRKLFYSQNTTMQAAQKYKYEEIKSIPENISISLNNILELAHSFNLSHSFQQGSREYVKRKQNKAKQRLLACIF